MLKKILKNKFLGRVDVINKILKYNKGKSYLEIGVRRGETIAQIEASNRIGVDPNLQLDRIAILKSKGNLDGVEFLEIPSDRFFQENTRTFDVIFIDGLHLYEQAIKDILNALNVLNEGGYIVVHDCNPMTEKAADRKQAKGIWSGDVWKSIYDIKINYPEIDYFVLNKDYGLGILSKKNGNENNYVPKFDENISNLDFSFLERNRNDILNLKDVKYFRNKFGDKGIWSKIKNNIS